MLDSALGRSFMNCDYEFNFNILPIGFSLNLHLCYAFSISLTLSFYFSFQFNSIGSHGTKIIIYNLWMNDEGIYELNFDDDEEVY